MSLNFFKNQQLQQSEPKQNAKSCQHEFCGTDMSSNSTSTTSSMAQTVAIFRMTKKILKKSAILPMDPVCCNYLLIIVVAIIIIIRAGPHQRCAEWLQQQQDLPDPTVINNLLFFLKSPVLLSHLFRCTTEGAFDKFIRSSHQLLRLHSISLPIETRSGTGLQRDS